MSTGVSTNQAAIQPYKMVLSQDPTQWSIYKSLASLVHTPAEQSHILLKGAWHALEREEYKVAEELSDAAHKCHGTIFFARLIDIELLKRQNQEVLIPKKLLEIADIFKQKGLPAQELKACKMLAQLEPHPAYYERVIALYAQTGKSKKAAAWTTALSNLTKPIVEVAPVQIKTTSDMLAASPLAKVIPTEPKETPAIASTTVIISSDVLPKQQEKKTALSTMVISADSASSISPAKTSHATIPTIAFGKVLWEKFFGDVGIEPPLPADIEKILDSPCPFWPNEKVRNTHMLVLIPETVNRKPFTLKTLGELVQKPRQGMATKYSYFDLGQYADSPTPKAHWALMSHDVVPNSRSKSYQDQQALVANFSQKTKLPYEVPTILDAATCIFMEYFRTDTRLYNDNPWTWTRCQEKYEGHWQLAVGGFVPGGLGVGYDVDGDDVGVGVLWKVGEERIAIAAPTSALAPQRVFPEPADTKQPIVVARPIVSASQLSKLPDIAFGKALWKKFFGDVGIEPPLPPDIEKILSSLCPFWPGKKVRETHMLVLIPQTVNGQPLTLKILGELVQKPHKGMATKYEYFNLGQYIDSPTPKAHWALMSRDVIPDSRNKSYQDQQALVASFSQKAKRPYVPTILDAATCIFMEYFRTGTRLYNDNPWTFTRCQEKYDGHWQLGVGGFAPGGLFVNGHYPVGNDFHGVGVLWKVGEERIVVAAPTSALASRSVFPEPTDTKQSIIVARPIVFASQLSKLPDIAFGKALWETFIGDVGVEPPLPADIEKILDSPCPFWDGFFNRKKVRDTHFLVLIPETVNGKPLTLKTLGELVQNPRQGTATKYKDFSLGQYTDPPAPKAHWALMSYSPVPDSGWTSYDTQQAIVASFSQKSKMPYEIPTILDVAACLFMAYFRTGYRYYSNNNYTRCQEKYDSTWQLCVGNFTPRGLYVSSYSNYYDYLSLKSYRGVGGLRKFREERMSTESFPPPVLEASRNIFREPDDTKQPIAIERPLIAVSQLSKLPNIAFGKVLWEKFFGDVGVEPPLPADIEKILDSPCPFWGGFFNRKKVRETHMLVLIPKTVNGKPLTLKFLGELVQKPRQGTATTYDSFYIGQYTDPPAPKAHWALMSRDVIPDSRNKSYQDQQALVASFSQKTKLPYEVPTIFDAVTCIFMEYFRTGTCLYSQNPWTYTRCQEKYDGTWRLVVGGFSPRGLFVHHYGVDDAIGGVGALWKFV